MRREGSTARLFGSARRTEVLVLLALVEESYPSEIARLLGAPLVSVLKVLDGLEREGVIASRALGRTRRVALEPRYFAAGELKAFLIKLAATVPHVSDAAANRRGRPRRRGKPL